MNDRPQNYKFKNDINDQNSIHVRQMKNFGIAILKSIFQYKP